MFLALLWEDNRGSFQNSNHSGNIVCIATARGVLFVLLWGLAPVVPFCFIFSDPLLSLLGTVFAQLAVAKVDLQLFSHAQRQEPCASRLSGWPRVNLEL